ncbi:MAG: beta-N-acetylhexosaminidase [Elusimicrobiota bacterium]
MTDPGRLFMFGVYGTKPERRTIDLFKSTGASGVLLLARNIVSPPQTRAFIQELEQRLGRPLLVAIDHEGGWVLRFQSGVTAFPGNAALGRAGDPKLAYAVGRHMAAELSALGVRMNLAPVVDVAVRSYNPGIGIRSFGANAQTAGLLGAAFIRGLQDHGVSACAKHFPGKGAATVDAHLTLPTINLSRAAVDRVHLAPFRAACAAGVDAVMTSHVRFPRLDAVPATFSTKIVRDILRKQLGYEGVIISDDLCMGAISTRWPPAQAALKCLEAGHDLLMIAHDLQAMSDAADILRQAGLGDAATAAAQARIERLLRPRKKSPPAFRRAAALSRRIAERAIRVSRRGALKIPLPAAETLILVPDFREVKERFTFEGGPGGPEALVRRLAPGARIVRTPIEMTGSSRLPEQISKADRILCLCFEARRFGGQAAVLKLLSKLAPAKTVAVLIRSSWDEDLCPKDMTLVDSAGYRHASIEAALSLILEKPS